MVDRLAKRVGDSVLRRRLVGGVGFDEQSVGRHLAEGVALAGFALVREGTGEAEVRAELGQRLNHFRRATVAVQQKTALGQRAVAEQLMQPSPRF